MNIREIKRDMHLLIYPKRAGKTATYNSQGWDSGMERLLGTIQKVRYVYTEGRNAVVFHNSDYYWDPDDLCIPEVLENVKFKGKKQVFNVEDLYV